MEKWFGLNGLTEQDQKILEQEFEAKASHESYEIADEGVRREIQVQAALTRRYLRELFQSYAEASLSERQLEESRFADED